MVSDSGSSSESSGDNEESKTEEEITENNLEGDENLGKEILFLFTSWFVKELCATSLWHLQLKAK